MRTGSHMGPRASSEQLANISITNRRVTQITPHPRFTSCGFQQENTAMKIEKESPRTLDFSSAISTTRITGGASVMPEM